MAKTRFKIQLVEGGTGVVAEEDPAYPLCKAIRKSGFTDIVLPLATLATGVLSDRLLSVDVDEDETFELLAGYSEQAAHVMDIEQTCVHHYILTMPRPNEPDVGTCKWCSDTKTYERFPSGQLLTSRQEMKNRKAMIEWESKLRIQESLTEIIDDGTEEDEDT